MGGSLRLSEMSLAHPTQRQATFELIFAGALWGFGFVATAWALTTWTPQGLLLWRFGGAFVLSEIVHLLARPLRKNKTDWKKDFWLSLPAGFLLGGFLLLQAIGLQSTSATKSGFITCLYVICVPAFNLIIFKKKSSLRLLFYIILACVGAFLLMDVKFNDAFGSMNRGDMWTLLCTILAAIHIIYIGRISEKVQDAFRMNSFQSLWAMLALLPLLLHDPQIQHSVVNMKSFWGLLVLAAASSVLAFFLQIRTQKVLSDTTASMLFLLESPYACLFAYFLLGDRLTSMQSLGAAVILMAALLTVRSEQSSETTTAPAVESPPPVSP